MKATTRLLVGGMVLAVGFQPVAATAGADGTNISHIVGMAALGQAPGNEAAGNENRREADELLRQARAAMNDGDLDKAESLVRRVEAMGVRYGLFALGDTPLKVRRDLDNLRRADRGTPQNYPDGGIPDGRVPGANAGGRTSSLPPVQSNRGDCDRLLVAARQALSMGDVRRAKALARQADDMHVKYGVFDDSPAKVTAAIGKYEQVMEDRNRNGNTETVRRKHAEVMLEQAEALLKWNLVDDAERIAQDAKRLGVPFNAYETNPDKLLDQVARARRMETDPQVQPAGHTAQVERLPAVNQQPSNRTADREPAPSARPAPRQPNGDKALASRLVNRAVQAYEAGDLDNAERFAREAQKLNVEFGPNEFHPQMVLHDIEKARSMQSRPSPRNTRPASEPANRPRYADNQTGSANPPRYADNNQPAPRYNNERPTGDRYGNGSQNELRYRDNGARPAGYQQDDRRGNENNFARRPGPATGEAMRLFQAGELAIESGDIERALTFYRRAYDMRNELDPQLQHQLEDRLKLLPSLQKNRDGNVRRVRNEEPTPPTREQLLTRQVATEVSRAQYEARKLQEDDPQKALNVLEEAKTKVTKSSLEAGAKETLTRRLDQSIDELQRYVDTNRPRIELEANNRRIKAEVARDREGKLEDQQKLAQLVDKFNKLLDEQRYREAEVVAKQAKQIAPNEPVTESMAIQSRFIINYIRNNQIREQKERGVEAAEASVLRSSAPFDDSNPLQYDVQRWEEINHLRRGADQLGRRQMSEKELEIRQKLKQPVSLQFDQKPLAEVIEYLGTLAGVNIHLDQRGLAEEGIQSNTPVSINLNQPVSLKSALNLILDPLRLSFVIKNEVLQVTSEQLRDGETYVQTYNVADLVIPIPNFVPGGNIGLNRAYNDALGAMGFGGRGMGHSPIGVLASKDGGANNAALPPELMAQFQPGMGLGMGNGGPPQSGPGMPGNANMGGPGGLGGGVQADFDSLIELITSTIAPQTWDEVGGRGSVQPFETNLSLVISQTQQVHEQIADLLDQLRRLQDLQVTIEVRFITLNDNFFERIGLDFNFNIDDDQDKPFQVFGNVINQNLPADAAGNRDFQNRDHNNYTFTGGWSPPANTGLAGANPAQFFTSDLDIPFRQGSFGLAVPQFGGYAAGAGATIGLAILSDIETYFFVEASQGDRRSNVLQAPKVTLFNGQVAFVADTAQSPFVISVIPVVGDFAAAFQPVIVVLSEGTFLSVQAVVSPDRRFVRLTMVPFFSQIGEVNEFTFQGESSTVTTNSNSQQGADDTSQADSTETRNSGTTVQLPTFAFVTVTTTVSVPDGGTVLLGGIKRLNEGRNEFGVPILNKLPYVNRLFRNVGIGRETQSLMMMVTPRIIIQEEEEALLGVSNGP